MSEGEKKAEIQRLVPYLVAGATSLFAFVVQNVRFEKETTLEVQLGIDSEPETIGTFGARLPASDEEQARIST